MTIWLTPQAVLWKRTLMIWVKWTTCMATWMTLPPCPVHIRMSPTYTIWTPMHHTLDRRKETIAVTMHTVRSMVGNWGRSIRDWSMIQAIKSLRCRQRMRDLNCRYMTCRILSNSKRGKTIKHTRRRQRTTLDCCNSMEMTLVFSKSKWWLLRE